MYTRAPFGLTNIPAHFQEAMDTIKLWRACKSLPLAM
jgi:hypothetical protein